ncbi:class I adenylate-forming enzyme family protein [Streptomyces sp. NBC_00893]|uniref:class I adenylate-forming enzyme family protein n=1 Tax=Streptomyces sp. NBC_00893 TaxID=2975862 RepID=UPI002259FED7|nr:AMP-binding protein [Streptomyces sp. NBC_00893]MCX4846074.1 AMP-binding protein [Streptomyces sp. NBC_00893]
MNLTWMLEKSARTSGAKPAVVSDLGSMTYAELLSASKRAAAVLRDRGVRPGDRVGVMMYNTPAFAVAAFGIWRAGAALVPINHKLTAHEVAYVVGHAKVRVAVVAEELAGRMGEGAPDVVALTTSDTGSGEFDLGVAQAQEWQGVEVGPDAVAQVLYTSGTTSAPKGCLHSHRGLSSVPAYTTAATGLRRDDRFLIAMPIWHAAPLNNWFLSMIYLGGTVVLLKEYQPVAFLEAVQKHRATAFFGAPIAYLAPLKTLEAAGRDLSGFDLSSMRLWAYGGAPLGARTVRMLQDAYGSDRFYQVYGMTEMGPVGSALYPDEQVTKAGSIGAGGMPGVDIRVVTADGSDARAGQTGELWLRSGTRMIGYLDDPVATERAFDGDWYRSGDLARVDEDGYLFIVDRLKDVVITGGENVFSPEVEEAVRQHPAVQDCAVIGRPHEEWGETVVAVVEANAAVTLDELRRFLAATLAKYKIPRELVVLPSLPRTPSGKVMKHVLREQALPGAH